MARIDRFIMNAILKRGVSSYVVVYDISHDRERSNVNKVLKGYGFRIQKSVFECRLNKRLQSELVKKLEGLELQTGSVRIYKVQYNSKKITIGKKQKDSKDDERYAFVV